MRPPLTALAAGALLAGPTALAFFTGGYFEGPRVTAGIVAGGLVLLAALVSPRPLPRSRSGRLAIGAMALFVAWSGASISWAPVKQDAYGDLERLLLYLAVLVAGAAFLRGRVALAAVEPVFAAGITIVLTYGLSERLLPGLLHFHKDFGAAGRLEQPLTYWNAMGALGAIGIVLCARLAGDGSRPTWMRSAAAACAAPVGTAFYLTLSRGAYGALLAGLLMLVALSPTKAQLRGIAFVLIAGAIPAALAGHSGGVQNFQGSLAHREAQGVIVLAVLVAGASGAAAAVAAVARAEQHRRIRPGVFRLPARPLLAALVPVVMVAVITLGGFIHERHRVNTFRAPTSASPQRLVSLTNDRYAYWGVAVDSFASHPIIGVGTSGFREEWLEHRPLPEIARDAHSLYIETAAELGVVGLAILAALLVAAAGSAREAVRVYPVRAPGIVAALVAFAVHAGLEWDWEFPALSLIAIALLGALIGAADGTPPGLGAPLQSQKAPGSRIRTRSRALA